MDSFLTLFEYEEFLICNQVSEHIGVSNKFSQEECSYINQIDDKKMYVLRPRTSDPKQSPQTKENKISVPEK